MSIKKVNVVLIGLTTHEEVQFQIMKNLNSIKTNSGDNKSYLIR